MECIVESTAICYTSGLCCKLLVNGLIPEQKVFRSYCSNCKQCGHTFSKYLDLLLKRVESTRKVLDFHKLVVVMTNETRSKCCRLASIAELTRFN
jgi:hypothetical protein